MYKTAMMTKPAKMFQPVLRRFILNSTHRTPIAMSIKYWNRHRRFMYIWSSTYIQPQIEVQHRDLLLAQSREVVFSECGFLPPMMPQEPPMVAGSS